MADLDQMGQGKLSPEEAAHATAVVSQALRSPLPRFYTNSFVNAITDADIMTIFQSNGLSVCLINMNYTVAKSYVRALTAAIDVYEKKLNTKVPDIELATIGTPSSPVKLP